MDLSCKHLQVGHDINSSVSWVLDEANQLFDSLLLETLVITNDILASLTNKFEDLSVGLRWLVHLLLDRLVENKIWNCVKLVSRITKRFKRAHEAEQGLDLAPCELPMLTEEVEGHES